MKTTPRITAVRPGDRPMTLHLTWADGMTAEVDLSGIIGRHRLLAPLADPARFAQVRVGEWGWSVEWGDDLDFGTDQLRRWAGEQSGDIMPTADFQAWRERNGLTLAATAAALGLSRRMVAYYDNGTWPVPKTVMLACEGWEARQAKRAA
jgi:hypothetical protein